MKGVFIAGTDTGVGKTVLAAALLSCLRARGMDAVPLKPVQTGCRREGARLVAPDLEFCLAAARFTPAPDEQDLMGPFRYEPACSPHLAAREAGETISIDAIETAATELGRRHEFLVVEGAGGVLAPVSEQYTMLDVMVRLGLPVVLAARPGLGTLNHTLLSLRELKRAELFVAAVVMVDLAPVEWGKIEQDNFRAIGRMGGIPAVEHLPYLGPLRAGSPDPAVFSKGACPPIIELVEMLAG
jgi:dethiobiotin synthetase